MFDVPQNNFQVIQISKFIDLGTIVDVTDQVEVNNFDCLQNF